ncbi:hypothetical protein TREMEDRAFT_21535, partial [Tremella mesenterica DSM 1558]|uniref:uncharacterized protein n=1 Tax=Tremella mesenterica (strain ATCC 24925 / CBS 8224 / DSM 1558 / NBRC 9311 / NRRL Y-6157 / RJB 2259-6 / UBC 559-6) TaxID=578456 RepID=UPI0003F494F9
DFTKQYNRLRQRQQALNPATGPSTSQPQPVPLPAQNSHLANSREKKGNRFVGTRAIVHGGVSSNPKAENDKHVKDKSDRATQEQVLDGRTRLVLAGLVNRDIIGPFTHCISTGKEANVYHATASPNRPLSLQQYSEFAVKIYRTSILHFRARQAYMEGEHRFQGEYTSSRNPRKMVRVWAEKELRNLRRLEQGGVRGPKAIELKENVLVMEFLGDGDSASPRLKDAPIEADRLPDLYAELLIAMRKMYQHCRLVHADLSEYNILYHQSHLYIIDVSQSVEHDHPRAFDFMRTDIRNVDDYFRRRSGGEVNTLGFRRTWDFVVNDTVDSLTKEDEMGEDGDIRLTDVLQTWLAKPDGENLAIQLARPDLEVLAKERDSATQVDEAVFMTSYIPRNLAQVYDPERDVELLRRGDHDKLIYAGITNLSLGAKSQSHEVTGDENHSPGKTGDGGSDAGIERSRSGGDSAGESESGEEHNRAPRGFRHEDREAKKGSFLRSTSIAWLTFQDRKKAVKEQNREKRKHKMPKAEKQRLI